MNIPLGVSFLIILAGVGLYQLQRLFALRRRLVAFRRMAYGDERKVMGFFHPNCSGGGGGERVLWLAIQSLMDRDPAWTFAIYTVDDAKKPILEKVKHVFGVTFAQPERIVFVQLKSGHLIQPQRWPRFTLLGQAFGSMVLAWEALTQLYPHVFIDTTGCAFTFPVVRLLGRARIACYVHYPTLSTDMLADVRARRAQFNNPTAVARSLLLTKLKLLYYHLFALLYRLVGSLATVVMVNSSWTAGHIRALWHRAPAVVYPPCNVAPLSAMPLHPRPPVVLAVAQFRPEKNHRLMLDAFARLLARPDTPAAAQLVLVGGCRDADDEQRLRQLQEQARELGISDRVRFVPNAPYAELLRLLGEAQVLLHTMVNEHFGISVVEGMAAGAIPVAHGSAGPAMDIVTPYQDRSTGFLARTPDEYAEAMAQVLTMEPQQRVSLAMRARLKAQCFSDTAFRDAFLQAMKPVMT